MWLEPCWWGDHNPECPFSFFLDLGHSQQKGQNRGERMLVPGRDFLIGMPLNRNTPSIVDHMFFFQMITSFSQVPEGSPFA
jgi:hypothetical protein